MAKKKKEDLDDDFEEDIGDLGDNDIESIYPSIKKPPSEEEKKTTTDVAPEESEGEEISEEELEIDLEEEEEFEKRDYKHLDLILIKDPGENDYELTIKGQSHGFCNILVKHLLKTEGVNSAAYKCTGLEPAKIFIRIKSGYEIKSILQKCIEVLRGEVLEVQKLFSKLM